MKLVPTSITDVSLPLYEDGDEDQPIGDIELSYEIINNEEKPKSKPIVDDDKAKTSIIETPTKSATSNYDKAKTTPLGDDKAKTVPVSNDDIENKDDNEQDGINDDIAILDNIIKSKEQSAKKSKKKKKKNLPPPPEWAVCCQPTSIPAFVQEELTTNESACSRLVIRVHSAICNGLATLDPSSTTVTASLKVSLSPFPGKQIIIKSTAGKSVDVSKKSTDVVFDFQQKSAILSMGIGDLRSKLYREGACPTISFELSFNGWTSYSSLYLPTIAKMNAGEIIAVPMVSNEMEATGRTLRSSIIFEINPLGETSNTSIVNNIKQPGKRTGTVVMEIDGIIGKGVTDLDTNMKLDASLLASDSKQSVSVNINAFDSGLVVGSTITLPSSWIDADVLEIKIGRDSLDQSQGRVMIPLGTLANLGSYEEGALVECNYKGTGRWLSGTVSKLRHSDGSFDVLYETKDIETNVKKNLLRKTGTIDDLWVSGQYNSFQSFVIDTSLAATNVGAWQLVGRLKISNIKSDPSSSSTTLPKSIADIPPSPTLDVTPFPPVIVTTKKQPEIIQSVTGELMCCLQGNTNTIT